MKSLTLSLALLTCASLSAQATTSIFVPDNSASTGSTNAIPFGSSKTSPTWANQIYQCLIPTSYAAGQPRVIHDLGFAPSSTNLHNFDSLTIRMGHCSNAQLSGTFASSFTTPAVTVLDVRDYTWRLQKDTWTRIGLQNSFTWIPQLGNLVIEIVAVGTGSAGSSSTGGFHRSTTIQRFYLYGWSGTPPTSGGRSSNAAVKVELVLDDPDASIFGVSCPGSNGNPTLSYAAPPKLGTTLDVQLSNGPNTGVAVLFVGFSISAPLFPIDLSLAGAPGCKVFVSPDLPAAVPITGGTGSSKLFLPPVPGYVGIKLWHQFVVLDPSANQMGLSFSEFGRALLGN
jgi:hypothetical protein